MTYTIRTGAVGHGFAGRPSHAATVVLVGCGGTGGFLADAVCRLLLGREADLYLVDPDRVEPHNVARQAFNRADVGRFKAEVLTERFMRRYGRQVYYSTAPYSPELHSRVFAGASRTPLQLLIGCVDNSEARKAIASTLDRGQPYPYREEQRVWWLDCGNGENSGQVLLGNRTDPEGLRGAFLRDEGACVALPAPSLQRPDLLDAPPAPEPRPATESDCAEAVIAGDQGDTINQFVAVVAAGYVSKLLRGECSWMATLFDLDDGTFRALAAEPVRVAQIAGLHVNAVAPPNPRGGARSVA